MSLDNLPTQPTPFIGRTVEVTRIKTLLANPACHLLTLVGPGGIGKTRLALEAARLYPDMFSNGVYFIPLQPLDSPNFMISAIAEGLGFQFHSGGEPKDQLLGYLQAKNMLLVMDNLEHLLDGVELVSDILQTASGVRILATARQRLNLVEEWVFEVEGLSFPASETELEIEGYSAVQLFLQSAQRASVGFQLNTTDKAGVIGICRIVGGMPLALELAATWVRALSCEEIAHEIERSLDILETPTRNVPARHRNMRAVLDQSWKQLSESEQTAFKKLSVFHGGFTRKGAQAVAGASLPTLAALVDKSLLLHNVDGRYDIHELLRQYAEEKLTRSGSEEMTRDAHSTYFLEFLSQREADIKGRRQLEALNEIEADFENIRVAWQCALRGRNYDALNRASESLFYFCEMRGRFLDAEELLWVAQEQLRAEPEKELRPIWGRVFMRGVWILMGPLCGTFEQLESRMEESLAIARQHSNRTEIAFCLWLFGALSHFTKDNASHITSLEESLALFTDLGDQFYMARTADWLGAVYSWNTHFDKFVQLSQQSLDWRRAIGDRFGTAAALMNLVAAAISIGQYDQAKRYLEEMDQIYLEIGGQGWAMRVPSNLSCIAFQQGDFHLAQTLAQKALDQYAWGGAVGSDGRWLALGILGMLATLEEDYARSRELCEHPPSERNTLYPVPEECLAVTACGLEDYAAARHYLLLALEAAVSTHDFRGMSILLPVAAILLTRDDQKDQAVELLGLAFNHPASAKAWMEQWSVLTRLRARLEAELGAEDYAADWERGKLSDLMMTSQGLLNYFQSDQSSQTIQTSNRSLVEPLSERELEVLQWIADGSSNAEIAAQLVVEVSTIKKHLTHIYDKLAVVSRTQAIARARELRLL